MIIHRFSSFLNENTGSTSLVCVDIQPAFKSSFGTKFITDFTKWLNTSVNDYAEVLYLYNGERMGWNDDVQGWLLDMGLDEEVLDVIDFKEKDYGWMRAPIDKGFLSETESMIIWMHNNNIESTQRMTDAQWDDAIKEYPVVSKIKDICEVDPIYIPKDVVNMLKHIKKADCVGGHSEECLAEIEILLTMLGTEHKRVNKFVY